METMVYFTVDGQEVCGRVDPGSATGPGESDAALRRYEPHAPDRSAERRGALTLKPRFDMKIAGDIAAPATMTYDRPAII